MNVIYSLGDRQTDTHTHTHACTDIPMLRTKAISRNQMHAWFKNPTDELLAIHVPHTCTVNVMQMFSVMTLCTNITLFAKSGCI